MKNNSLIKYLLIVSLTSGCTLVHADFLRSLGEVVSAPVEVAANVAEDAVEITADATKKVVKGTADVVDTAVVGTEEIVTAPVRAMHNNDEIAYNNEIVEEIN